MSIHVSQAVWEHGPEKAADRMMLLAIAEHADDRGHAWPGIERLAARCCVKPRAATYTVRRLEAAGWITTTIGGGGRSNRYQIDLARLQPPVQSTAPTPAVDCTQPLQPTAGEPSGKPPVEPPLPAAAASGASGVPAEDAPSPVARSQDHQPSPAAEREHMSTAREAKPAPTDQPLLGMPEPQAPAPEPSAGELVKAWCRGWSQSHGGAQPHTSVVRRVAGVCRNVAKDCADMDEWRDAWRAALTAGQAGRYDVVAHLAAPAPLGRQNYHLALASDPEQITSGGLLGAMLGQATTPAIGSAS